MDKNLKPKDWQNLAEFLRVGQWPMSGEQAAVLTDLRRKIDAKIGEDSNESNAKPHVSYDSDHLLGEQITKALERAREEGRIGAKPSDGPCD